MANVRQYATQTAQAIGAMFERESMAVRMLGVKQGPHTLTFAVQLAEPTRANLSKALALAPAVEAAIYDEPVRIEMRRGMVMVQIPSPTPIMVDGTRMSGNGLFVPLGVTALRGVRGVNFEREAHVLIVAPTGKGKTTTARCIAYHLATQNTPADVRFIVSTFKPRDWKAFAGLPHTQAVIVRPAESAAMLRWLLSVVYDRTSTGVDTPHLFMVLDDLLNLLGVEDVADELAQIASLGRAAGVHLIIGTQRLGKRGAGDAAVTGNITTRVVLGVASGNDAAQFTGRGKTGAERLGKHDGDALLVQDGDAVRLAIGYVSDDALSGLVTGAPVHEPAPWLARVRTGAPVHNAPVFCDSGAETGATSTGAPVRPDDAQNAAEPAEEPVTFPLQRQPATPAERAAIAEAYERNGQSLNRTVVEVYGAKGSLTMMLLKEALGL